MRGEGDKRSNCCSWEGVECDEDTGRVIGLDLSSSCIYGSINSNSTLFQLVHLQWLDLSDNNFNSSEIPSRLGHDLTGLTYLNLSMSLFAGQIPPEISKLSKLSNLDLSYSDKKLSLGGSYPLKLTKVNLRSLAHNLTNIKHLRLSKVEIKSTVPDILVNASSLTSLRLLDCGLYGEFPVDIFHLPSLEFLNVYANLDLTGYFPNFNSTNSLKKVLVGQTNFSGELPTSIGNLHSLNVLDISDCKFYPRLPSSLANLTQLIYLDISSFYDASNSIISIGQLASYSWSWVGKLTNLYRLGLESTKLSVKFPSFVANLTQLEFLVLAYTNITGQIPFWLSKLTQLTFLDLSGNLLTGFDQAPVILPWQNLICLSLGYNRLQGSLPIPPQSIIVYSACNNDYSGEIPPLFCNLNYLDYLDLSNNNLSGLLPECFGSSSAFGSLILKNNSLQGNIPPMCSKGNSLLTLIDLSYNQLQGKLPRSMANCTQLEALDFGNNQMSDIFPSWLGALPALRALVLRSNGFHGIIGKPATNHEFPNLAIIDLSNNGFSGMLPARYLEIWNCMKFVDQNKETYFEVKSTVKSGSYQFLMHYSLRMTLFGKGVELKYFETPYLLKLIDLSHNRFEGEIPAGTIGNLTGLVFLNLSNNILTGRIPSSLGNLTALESLDLSQNKLSGRIPGNLAQLNFLGYFNVSHNRLWGPIPLGRHLDTFSNDSYQGNPGLCGTPLSKKCEDFESSTRPAPSILEEEEDSGFQIGLDWYVVLPGVVSGLIVGVVVGNNFANKKHEWFVKKFSRRMEPRGARRRRGRRT